jgi:hypothetical protein
MGRSPIIRWICPVSAGETSASPAPKNRRHSKAASMLQYQSRRHPLDATPNSYPRPPGQTPTKPGKPDLTYFSNSSRTNASPERIRIEGTAKGVAMNRFHSRSRTRALSALSKRYPSEFFLLSSEFFRHGGASMHSGATMGAVRCDLGGALGALWERFFHEQLLDLILNLCPHPHLSKRPPLKHFFFHPSASSIVDPPSSMFEDPAALSRSLPRFHPILTRFPPGF